MKHFGDITKLHGYDLPPVDVITGGSPCQDLSVAGKRAGMLHESNGDETTTRSGLFYDQVRIIKEMRDAYVQEDVGGSDRLVRGARYPRYQIWENVPGALSAGKEKGEAFQAVLTEFVRIVEPDAPPVPMPQKGRWPSAGCLYDPMGRWSVAWRVHDLQWWGCPQRRKRVCVLCDFDGPTAPWILFDPQFRGEAADTTTEQAESDTRTGAGRKVQSLAEGMPGHPQSGQSPRQGVAAGTEDRAGEPSSYTLKVRGGIEVDSHGRKAGKGALVQTELSGTLGVSQDQTLIQPCLSGQQMSVSHERTDTLRANMKHHEPIVYENHSQDSRYKELGDTSETVSAKYGTGGNNQPLVLENNQNHGTVTDNGVVNTLPAAMGMGGGYIPMVVDDPAVAYGIDQQGGKGGANYAEDVCPPVLSDSHGTPHAVAYGVDHVITTGGNCTAKGPCVYEEKEATLKAGGPHAVAYGISSYDSNAMKSPNPHSGIYEADSSRTLDLNGGSPACNQGGVAIVEPVPSTEHHAVGSYQDTTGALMASGYDKLGTQEAANDMYVVGTNWDGTDTAPTLTKNNAGGNQRMPDKDNFNAVLTDQGGVECLQNGFYQATGDQAPSLLSRDYKDPPVVKKPQSVVRRLTPVECERLQGYPDFWTDLGEWTDSKGKTHKDADSPRYKALGNSIGLPFWQWLAERIAAQYDRPVTLGSLFDGIGGFPLVFERAGGKAVWASEIEEFPIAVTKKHFPEEE